MTSHSIIQNTVFPLDHDPDSLPLYLDAETWTTIGSAPVRVSSHAHVDSVVGRTAARIDPDRRVSFASYFNAFPASYWQHWTNVRSVRLELTTSGSGTILVYRSNAQGVAQRMATLRIDGEHASTSVDLPVTTFGDGGWYWFDIEADDTAVTIERGLWTTDADPRRTGKVSLGITTHNKPGYCVATLQALAANADVLEQIDRIFVTDQGTKLVSDEPEFDEIASALGDKLQIIRQPNLGGSGGFSRAMAETLKRPESGFVLLLDDDVKIEPESILRALQFGRFATQPTLVGGHMFDLLDRPVMHAFAEVVDTEPFIWRPRFSDLVPHDFANSNLRQTRWLHTRMDSDYNGWWFCLIPTEVVLEIGLALPAFIKWDDTEYCLRAREHGFATVSLPGAALWHVSWLDKDDSIDWQAYFHARNRLVTALLHSPHPNGGAFPRDSRRLDLKHLLSMQYYPVALRHRALLDVLSGPRHMHAQLPSVLGELTTLASGFREKRVLTGSDVPVTARGKQVYAISSDGRPAQGPRGIPLIMFTARAVLRHWFTKPPAESIDRPEAELAKRDATWFRVPGFDSALVSTADGSGKNWYQRDRRLFRSMLSDSIRLHRRIAREWGTLREAYREALPELTSIETWTATFGVEPGTAPVSKPRAATKKRRSAR